MNVYQRYVTRFRQGFRWPQISYCGSCTPSLSQLRLPLYRMNLVRHKKHAWGNWNKKIGQEDAWRKTRGVRSRRVEPMGREVIGDWIQVTPVPLLNAMRVPKHIRSPSDSHSNADIWWRPMNSMIIDKFQFVLGRSYNNVTWTFESETSVSIPNYHRPHSKLSWIFDKLDNITSCLGLPLGRLGIGGQISTCHNYQPSERMPKLLCSNL